MVMIWFARAHCLHGLGAKYPLGILVSYVIATRKKKDITEQGRTPGPPATFKRNRTGSGSTKEPWTHIPTHKERPYFENQWKECEMISCFLRPQYLKYLHFGPWAGMLIVCLWRFGWLLGRLKHNLSNHTYLKWMKSPVTTTAQRQH